MNKELSVRANHYECIKRDISKITSLIDGLMLNALEQKVDNEVATTKWPKKQNGPGKKKEPPKEYKEKVVYDNWESYEVDQVRGLKVFTFVRRGTWIDCFYSLDMKSSELPKEDIVNYVNYVVTKSTFENSYNKNWTKDSVTKLGVDLILEQTPKNIYFDKNLSVKDTTSRYAMSLSLRKEMGHAICHGCSGKSKSGLALFRYYESAAELFEHCRNHDDIIPEFSFINLQLDPNFWILTLATAKPRVMYLMQRQHVTDKISVKKREIELKNRDHLFGPRIRQGGGEDDTGEIDELDEPVSFRIYGWNARSLFKAENEYKVNKFLATTKPDFLLINESGSHKKTIERVSKDYELKISGNKLATIYRKDIAVTPLWTESWSNVTMIFKVTLRMKSLILVNCYRPPNDESAKDKIVSLLRIIDNRYKNTPIIVFGDLNYVKEKVEKELNISNRGYRVLYDNSCGSYTREQPTYLGVQRSYLDYFIVKEISNFNLAIMEPIGNSDHMTLRLIIKDTNMRIARRLFYTHIMSNVQRDAENISLRLKAALESEDKVNGITSLISSLRSEHKPKAIKLKSHFKTIEKLVKYKNWMDIRRIITQCNRADFVAYMEEIEKLQVNRKDKEYFMRIRFYSDLNKNVGVLKDYKIIDDDGETIVTSDKTIIDDRVTKKYEKLFRSGNGKKMISPINDERRVYTEDEVRSALKRFNLKKATSWDMIPGMAFKPLIEDDTAIRNLTILINQLVRLDRLPDELSVARLFCLNKNNLEPGSDNSIRPLTIVGIITKIIEDPLVKELREAKTHKAQVGFKPKLSTEINIMRLKWEVHKINYKDYDRKKKMTPKYILFLDFCQAFDSVEHETLKMKLLIKKIRIVTINTLIFLLNSGMVSINLRDIININCSVGQGKLASPDEFDLYIDDLFEVTEGVADASLGYADDTAYACMTRLVLILTMKVVEEWSKENKLLVNKNKSGVLIINDDGSEASEINGYPVITSYKYLGVYIDSKLSPRGHITAVNSKLKEYLKRNRYLHRKYFSPFSLMRLNECFVKSRLCYGLCSFLQDKTAMTRLNKTMFKHIKSILGLPENTSHARLQITLGEPDIKTRLLIRLIKNWHKYYNHFGEYPLIFEKELLSVFSREDLYEVREKSDFKILRQRLIDDDLGKKAEAYIDYPIRTKHADHLRKYFYTYPDRRDFLLINYFTCTTKATNLRLFPMCECGSENITGHAANECGNKLSDTERNDTIKEFDKLFETMGVEKRNNLHDYLCFCYFSLVTKDVKSLRKVITLIKKTITILVIRKPDIDDAREGTNNADDETGATESRRIEDEEDFEAEKAGNNDADIGEDDPYWMFEKMK